MNLEGDKAASVRLSMPLFDVDGVITHPWTKKPNPILIDYLARRLFAKAPIGLASTRDFAWVEANVIDPVRSSLPIDRLNWLFISTEKSAVTTIYQNGQVIKEYDESLRVPQDIGKRLEERIARYDATFYYPKETLYTAEVYEGGNQKEQDLQLDELFAWVQEELIPHGSPFKADRTAIAIDIYNARGNKAISARRFLAFLEDKGLKLHDFRFIAIGDGLTDLEMADGIRAIGYDVEFGWVGSKPLQDARGHRVILPNAGENYDLGTVALLRQIGELAHDKII